jgi:magnesium transporter
MSEAAPELDTKGAPSDAGDDGIGPDPELFYKLRDALEAGRVGGVEELVEPLHPADLADVLEDLSGDERTLLLDIIGPSLDPEVLTYLDSAIKEELLEYLGPHGLAKLLGELESDDATDFIEDLDDEEQQRILAALAPPDRAALEESLAYPEDSAGRLMQREIVAVPATWTVGDAIDYLRSSRDLPDDFYTLYIVDSGRRPQGSVPLSRVLRTRRPIKVTDIMDAELRAVSVTTDQEEVAYLFRQYGLVSAAVLDDEGRMVGVITVDDVVHVIDEEAEEDFMALGGVSETDLYSAVIDTAKARFTWLGVNLATAVVASLVIGLFEGTLERVVALAVLMPIVASMGGNAGTQTLTVAVRAMAMKDLTEANAWRFVGKELLVGAFNAVAFGVVTGAVAWIWFGQPLIGLVIAAAMVVNLVVAALAGTLVPIGLERLKIDPAIASGTLLTTVTDVVGFAAFLGLAAAFIL